MLPARSFVLAAAVTVAVASTAFLSIERDAPAPPAPPAAERSAAKQEPRPTPSRAEQKTTRRASPAAAEPTKDVVAVTAETQRSRTTVSRPQPEQRRRPSNPLEPSYPKHFRATQNDAKPATMHWALIIGINDYAGGTTDTVGSVNDAKALRAHLLANGWRSDHILMLLDRRATADNIVHALRWLRSKTTTRSVVVFHYSGHEKPVRTRSDGDDEPRDVALWAADNRLVVDGDLGREMGRVRAARMWINLAVCRAGGFDDPGMRKANRVITYSSPERELSYEDPAVEHSVFGYHALAKGSRDGFADRNDDGEVTVEEAFAYARPRVVDHTSDRQHPVIVDELPGSFSLRVPDPPREPEPDPKGTPSPCTLGVVCRP